MGTDNSLKVQYQCARWLPGEGRRQSQMADIARVLQLCHHGQR